MAFGKYSLVARLAKGGMAEIMLARLKGAAGFEKLVCIKRILPHLAEDEQFISMFLSEARIAALISHPNVCQVFELGELDGVYYIAMEYLEGVPLASMRRRDLYPKEPDPQLVVGIVAQACEGLHHAHELTRPDESSLDVVHRDVSAQNLFVTTSGVVKVLDFGIAKIQDASSKTSTGAVKGTYAYMAPEQLRGEKVDRRTDVFALGIVMWETLAQRHLFRRDTDFLTFQAITTDPIPDICTVRPQVPPALGAAIARAMARNPDDRFATAREFAEALTLSVHSLGGMPGPSKIGEEISRSFDARLKEQRALVRLAREGGGLDLGVDSLPGLGHGIPMRATPPASFAAVEPARDVKTEILTPTGPRSETIAVKPLPPPEPSEPDGSAAPARDWRRLGLVLAVAAIAAGAGIGLLVHLAGGGKRTADAGAATVAVDARGAVVAVDARGAAVAVDAAVAQVVVDADDPAIEIEVIDAAVAPTAVDAAVPPADASIVVVDAGAPASVPLVNRPPVRAQAPGFLTIDSTPVYAEIVIDGKAYGETPLFNLELSAGRHRVRAISPSKAIKNLTVTIEPGKVAVRRIEW